MAPSFKNPLRGFLSSVLPSSLMSSLGTTAGSKAVPHLGVPMAIIVWVQLIMMCLDGWTSRSVETWLELLGYRLDKAYHCKFTNTRNEHEFVIYEFTNEHKIKLELRTDRAAGVRKDASSSSSSVGSFGTDVGGSLSPGSSNSSLSLSSMRGSITKASNSVRHSMRRVSDSSLSRPSGISSNQYLAADMVVRIEGHPAHSKVLKTITFTGDRSLRPSLWDVMILTLVVHKDSTAYTILGRQCYWFADTLFGTLEKWAEIHHNGTVVEGGKKRTRWGLRQASTGSLGVVTVHRRDPEQIEKIWGDFHKEKQIMDQQKEEYERTRTEEVETTKKLAGQVEFLKKGQEESERRREESERRREESERRHQEEQRLLKQQLAEQQRQMQEQMEEKDRHWQMQMHQKDEETERRIQRLEQHMMRMSGSTVHLDAPPSVQPVRRKGRV